MLSKKETQNAIREIVRIYNGIIPEETTPRETALQIVNSMRLNDAREAMAVMIKDRLFDGRISGENKNYWSKTPSWEKPENEWIGVSCIDRIHPAHLNQLADELRVICRAADFQKEITDIKAADPNIHTSPDFQCDQTGGFPTSLCVSWEKGKAWLELNEGMITDTYNMASYEHGCVQFGIRSCNDTETFNSLLRTLGEDAIQNAELFDETVICTDENEECEKERITKSDDILRRITEAFETGADEEEPEL